MVAKKANKSSRYLEEAMREEEDYRVRVYSVHGLHASLFIVIRCKKRLHGIREPCHSSFLSAFNILLKYHLIFDFIVSIP